MILLVALAALGLFGGAVLLGKFLRVRRARQDEEAAFARWARMRQCAKAKARAAAEGRDLGYPPDESDGEL